VEGDPSYCKKKGGGTEVKKGMICFRYLGREFSGKGSKGRKSKGEGYPPFLTCLQQAEGEGSQKDVPLKSKLKTWGANGSKEVASKGKLSIKKTIKKLFVSMAHRGGKESEGERRKKGEGNIGVRILAWWGGRVVE